MSTLERKNLPLVEQILSFKSRHPFGKVLSFLETNRKSQSYFPFEEMAEINDVRATPYNLSVSSFKFILTSVSSMLYTVRIALNMTVFAFSTRL